MVSVDVWGHSCCFVGFSHRFTRGEPAAVPVVPCSERCSGRAGERFPWQLLSLMNKVCFLMNGQSPEQRRSWLGVRRAVTLRTAPRGGQDHPEQGSALRFPLLLAALEGFTSIFPFSQLFRVSPVP